MDGLRTRAGKRRPSLDRVRDRLAERGGWLGAAGERIRPWHAIPAAVAALALIIGGFWLGGAVGGHASAAVLTNTVKLKGKVVTIDGSRYVSTPAVTVKVKGKTVHIPARTIKLPGSTVVSGKTVPVDVNRTVKVPVTVSTTDTQTNTTTVNHTVTTVATVVQTVTGPTTTVNGPPITITVPGPTVTVTVTT
jgi:hypothetical protein